VRRSLLVSLLGTVLGTIALLSLALIQGWQPLLGLDLQGGTEVVLRPTSPASAEELDQAIEVIRNRVDAIGVAEPDITRQGDTVVVQLPGIEDAERARSLVGQTAELRFRTVLSQFDPEDPASRAQVAEAMAGLEEAEAAATTTTVPASPTTVPEGAATTAPASPTTVAAGAATTVAPATTAPTTATTALDPATAPTLDEILTPPEENEADVTVVLLDNTGAVGYVLAPAQATGEVVTGANADFVGVWQVQIGLNDDGNDLLNSNIGQTLGVELDGVVYSAATVNAADFSGSAVLSGNFDEDAARDIALVLRFGSLPVELEELSARSVSATLGQDALQAGILAGLIGLLLVGGYLCLYYRLLGAVALASLAISGGLLWALIAWMGEYRGLALTLAGATGIIVSIGIAVDSNIVYYERIKEEVRRGRSVRSAADGGFRGAFSTMVKADTASLIGAAILYYVSVGSVRGFALFLGIATVIDLVVSLLFTRPAVVLLARSRFGSNPHWLGLVLPEDLEDPVQAEVRPEPEEVEVLA
jgi:preprotein translocase subunit SecD